MLLLRYNLFKESLIRSFQNFPIYALACQCLTLFAPDSGAVPGAGKRNAAACATPSVVADVAAVVASCLAAAAVVAVAFAAVGEACCSAVQDLQLAAEAHL